MSKDVRDVEEVKIDFRSVAWQNGFMQRRYTVVLHKAEDGWWVANVPILHATAQGRTRSVALKRAKSLIRFALDTMQGCSGSTEHLSIPH